MTKWKHDFLDLLNFKLESCLDVIVDEFEFILSFDTFKLGPEITFIGCLGS